MNGQQPNHVAGMQGYTLTPQQQAAMMQHQQHQYSRMLNQQQQQQLPPQQSQQQQAMAAVPQQQQQPQQGAYNQNFYQQGYIQNIQAAHGLLAGNNPHINNTQQQMMMPQNQQPSQQQQQQFYVAQQFQQQQQLPQSQIHQQQHHQQSQSQIQYTPQAAAIYQQQQQQDAAAAVAQQRIIPQQQPQVQAHATVVSQSQRRQQPQPQVKQQQSEASSMHRNISQTSSTSTSLSRQSAFSQPISQSHIPIAPAAASVVSQQQYYEQQQPQSQVQQPQHQNYSIYEQAAHAQAQLQQQTQHHSYLPPQHHQQQQIQGAAAASGHRLSQQQQQQKSHLKSQISQEVLQSQHQQHVILNPKPSKPSTAKEAENSALHNDMIRKQRAAEEKQKQMEREKRETQKIQDEFQTKQKQANQYAQSVQEKLDQFKYPILFAGCHLTTNLTKILPLPSEHVDPVDMPIYQADGCADLLRRDDPILIEYMSGLLLNSFEDVKEINVKHSEIEANIYDGSELPPLMKGIHNFNQYSFHVQTEFDDITLDPELAKAVDEVAADGGIGDLLQFVESEDNLPSTSSTSIMPTTIQQPHHQHHHHQVASASMAPPQPSIARTMSKPVNTTGKEPKGKEKAFANSRRKRDMAEGLVDSLTPYYDVSGDRSRKRKHGSTQRDSESDEENQPQTSSGIGGGTSDEPKFFNKSKKPKKAKREEEPERPPTPTEIIKQREMEWAERERHLQDKLRRRQMQAEAEGLCVAAEGESQIKAEALIEQIFDQVGGFDVFSFENGTSLSDVLIDRKLLSELRQEAQKLKSWRKLHKLDGDRLAKLVQMLEKNIRDVIDEDGQLICKDLLESDDVANEVARELLNERFIRASEAATLGLVIMTSHRAPKQAMVEDTMERAAQLCKQLLSNVIYPAADTIVRNTKNKKAEAARRRKGGGGDLSNSGIHGIYVRVVDMIECFSELIRSFQMNEVLVSQLSTMATNPFFVDGIGEIHMASIQLLSIIFRKFENFRQDIIKDLLCSIHQLPPSKNIKNCYRLSNTENIHNFTVLILQLVQSVVIIPTKKRTDDGEDEKPSEEDDSAIVNCFKEAQNRAGLFLQGFLHKCTAKAEEDYRRRFENFLQDLLTVLHRPDWPAAELMLTVLASVLVNSFRNKSLDISLRSASMEYLGTITARLRRDRNKNNFDREQLNIVIKSILYDESNNPTKLLDDIDTSVLSSTEKMQKLQQALIDFLIATKTDNDVSAEYAISFYAGEWYKKTVEDINALRQNFQQKISNLSENELKKAEKSHKKIMERSENMKQFLLKLADKKNLKKRSTYVAKTGKYLIDIDASWTVKYLASKKEFSQSFDIYLNCILKEVQSDSPVTLRTKAIKCLSQIIEADTNVLDSPQVHVIVQSRMMDLNSLVREAVIELVGKYLIFRPDLFDNYYSVLCDRILDTGVAVRKRVIRIFRDYVEKVPESPKVAEILSKIVRRVSDEEGVKKLALDTLTTYWFTPISDKKFLKEKVIILIDAVNLLKDVKGEPVETFFISFLKKDEIDKNALYAAKQIVDTLVDYVFELEDQVAKNQFQQQQQNESINSMMTEEQKIEKEKINQNRLLSSLTTLSIISKICPESIVRHAFVFLPHLSRNIQTPSELQVLNQVINMLERVIPLMEQPSKDFLKKLDDKLCDIIRKKGMLLIQSAIACLGAVYKQWNTLFPEGKSNISKVFLSYVAFLNKIKESLGNNISSSIPPNVQGNLKRWLFSVGIMCRYFDFDLMIDKKQPTTMMTSSSLSTSPPPPTTEMNSTHGIEDKREIRVYAEATYTYLFFFSRSSDAEISEKALASLGHLCSEYPDFFERHELRNMFQGLLASNEEKHLPLKVEVLKTLSLFLTVEEERMVKAREEYKRLRDAGELEDDLANTDTRGSLNSTVIQVFWKHVLASYLHCNSKVRIAVSQVVYQTMMQGLVTPGDPLPTMIAMTTDSVSSIRNKIEPLLKEIDQKYAGMLASKATLGIRWTFEMHRQLNLGKNSYVFRGFRASEHCTANVLDKNGLPKNSAEAVAVLNALYACLRTNRNQRRSFLNNVVRMFSEDSREKMTLEEMLFVADNLATFPFQVMDEPLYIIHTADAITSLSGQNVLTSVKQMLLPKRYGELVDEEDEFTVENIYRRLPEDKTQIFELMKTSQACFLLLEIKNYLKKLYRLSDQRVNEYSPAESAKVTDKPIARQQIGIFSPDFTLTELRPEVIAKRDTVEGHINLCEQLVNFRNIFFSLDNNQVASDDEDNKIESADETLNDSTTTTTTSKRTRGAAAAAANVVDDDEDDD